MTTPCQAPLPLEALIAYHLRELPEAERDRVEEHYFGCAYCSERLETLSRLEQGLQDLAHGGGLMVSSTVAMVEYARARGVRVREYRTEPGEHVNCTAGPDDDLLVTRYGGLRGLTSVDIHFRGTILGTEQLIEMVFPGCPVDQQTGDVVLIAPGAINRSMPPLEIEISASVPGEVQQAGQYFYHHRPWDMLDDAERQRRAGR